MNDGIANAIHGAGEFHDPLKRPLTVLTAAEFAALNLPPREYLIRPWLPAKGLAMVYARPGVGKTWFALSAAYAVATGGNFLSFSAPAPKRVLYLDGEMPSEAVRDRLADIMNASNLKPPSDDYFRILSADRNEFGLPDLSDPDGQTAIAPHVETADLIVVDNISTLVRHGRENEAESWQPIQDWALRQRRCGRSVLFVHHSGKTGAQRGTSKREDVLDTVICLKRPDGYESSQGARFEVHFDKARGLFGKDAEPFEALCSVNRGKAVWSASKIINADLKRIEPLFASGMSVRQIAEETGLSKSKVDRLVKQLPAISKSPLSDS